MGTKMAPSHANLFMGKFEQEALAAAPHSPLIWWCYIDDIFFPWTHGEDKLNDSITYLNNLHLTIKFTSSFSYNEILFLDVKECSSTADWKLTFMSNPPTSISTSLNHLAIHPTLKQSIPFSMALRLRRICSTDEFFNTPRQRDDINTASLKTQ